tara:strand:- start:966 stop:1163 length:198 start_codon:yes stop_codon:yes gene_type:complete
MSEKKLNIKKKILRLEGRHHLYPKGISKKINIKKLSEQQEDVILYHYSNIFGEAIWEKPRIDTDI